MDPSELPQGYWDRLAAGLIVPRDRRPRMAAAVADIPVDATTATMRRTGASHRGISQRPQLRTLIASQVNQAFLDEICELEGLERLELQGVTATDLNGLGRLPALERLVIEGATRIEDLSFVSALSPSVRALRIEYTPRVESIEPLGELRQLRALAFEGSLLKRARIKTLAPLERLTQLEWLFLTAVVTDDRQLSWLAPLKRLKVLEFADYYAPGEVDALAVALPTTRCHWFTSTNRREHRPMKK